MHNNYYYNKKLINKDSHRCRGKYTNKVGIEYGGRLLYIIIYFFIFLIRVTARLVTATVHCSIPEVHLAKALCYSHEGGRVGGRKGGRN